MKRFDLPISNAPLFRSVIPNGLYHKITDACVSKYPVSVSVECNDIVVRLLDNGIKMATIEPSPEMKMYCVNVPQLMFRDNQVSRFDWIQWLSYALPVAARYNKLNLPAKLNMLPNEDDHSPLCGTYTLAFNDSNVDRMISGLLEMIDGLLKSIDDFYDFVQRAIGNLEQWMDKPFPVIISEGELGNLADALMYAHEIASSASLISDALESKQDG